MSTAFTSLVASMGPYAVLLLVALVFCETGLLLGFFLPGDSVLFTTGLLVAGHVVDTPVAIVIAAASAAAIGGDRLGYLIGARLGPRLLERTTGSRTHQHVVAARSFFARHGTKAVVYARFVPVARTFTPVIAGAVGMPRRRFTTFNVLGGTGWVTSNVLAGYFLGRIPPIADHVELFALGVTTLTLLPLVAKIYRRGRRSDDGLRAQVPDAVVSPADLVGSAR